MVTLIVFLIKERTKSHIFEKYHIKDFQSEIKNKRTLRRHVTVKYTIIKRTNTVNLLFLLLTNVYWNEREIYKEEAVYGHI